MYDSQAPLPRLVDLMFCLWSFLNEHILFSVFFFFSDQRYLKARSNGGDHARDTPEAFGTGGIRPGAEGWDCAPLGAASGREESAV